jgi:restriction system protein
VNSSSRTGEEELDPGEKSTTILDESGGLDGVEIRRHLRNMSSHDLKAIVCALLQLQLRYNVTWTGLSDSDEEMEFLGCADDDPPGTTYPRIKVRVEKHPHIVGLEDFLSFMKLVGDKDFGILVSVGGFITDPKHLEAMQMGERKIRLVDMDRLLDLWLENYDLLSETDKRLLPL